MVIAGISYRAGLHHQVTHFTIACFYLVADKNGEADSDGDWILNDTAPYTGRQCAF